MRLGAKEVNVAYDWRWCWPWREFGFGRVFEEVMEDEMIIKRSRISNMG